MNIAEMVFTITDPSAPVPAIPHLTIAELERVVNDTPTRIVRREVECKGIVGDEDDWEDKTPCAFAGTVDVSVFDDTEEAIWVCPSDHENSIRWESI